MEKSGLTQKLLIIIAGALALLFVFSLVLTILIPKHYAKLQREMQKNPTHIAIVDATSYCNDCILTLSSAQFSTQLKKESEYAPEFSEEVENLDNSLANTNLGIYIDESNKSLYTANIKDFEDLRDYLDGEDQYYLSNIDRYMEIRMTSKPILIAVTAITGGATLLLSVVIIVLKKKMM